MADMLNASYERDNARLFGDEDDGREAGDLERKFGSGYTMVTTRDIEAGEQIVIRFCL